MLEVGAAPAYAGEEAVFGEDGDSVEEEDGDVDEGTEAKKGEHRGQVGLMSEVLVVEGERRRYKSARGGVDFEK